MSKLLRETNIDISEYEQSLISEIDGLRDTSLELIKALRIMCCSFPAPAEIIEIVNKFKHIKEKK